MGNKGLHGIRSFCKERTFLLLSGIQVLVLILILLFCNIKYEVSDDFVMEMILSGTYTGECDVHVMFSNVMWAALLVPLYTIMPGVSWYLVAQLLVCLISYITISYVFSKVLPQPAAMIVTVVITVFTAMDVYILPQFTKTATVAVIAGAMLFLWALYHKGPRFAVLAGGALVVLGSWIRLYTIFVAAPFVAFVLIYETATRLVEKRETFKEMSLRVFLPGCMLITVIFGSMCVNNFFYDRDAEYALFKEYCSVRSSVVDYWLPSYEECAEEFADIGVSENDYQMILNWNFGDSEAFSLEKMRQINDVLQRYRTDHAQTLWEILYGAVRRKQVLYPGAICCILLGSWCIFQDKKRFWIPGCLALIILSFFVYFSAVGRSVYRVEFGFFFSAAVCIGLYLPVKSTPRMRMGKWAFSILAMLLVIQQLGCYVPDQSYQKLSQEEYRSYIDDTLYRSWDYSADKYRKTVSPGKIRPDFLEEVSSNPQNLYVLDFNTTIQTLYYDFSPFESAADSFPKNLVYLGGVLVNHPSVQISGINNAELLDILTEDHVYFVSNGTAEIVLRFLREHGYPQAEMELYRTLDGYQIWKYSNFIG